VLKLLICKWLRKTGRITCKVPLGLQITRGSFDYLLNRLYNHRTNRGLLSAYSFDQAIKQVEATRFAATNFFQAIANYYAGQERGTGRVRMPHIVNDPVSEELTKLGSAISEIAKEIESDQEKIEYVAAAARCVGLAENLKSWLEQAYAEQVYWIEVSGENARRITLASAPIEVGPALKKQLYDKVPSVILTSATLSAGGQAGFAHFQHRLGLANCGTLQLGSPFDYQNQAELHLFRRMPDPASAASAFEEACLARIQ
jgi:ATP-dependent DNA helicase DinG